MRRISRWKVPVGRQPRRLRRGLIGIGLLAVTASAVQVVAQSDLPAQRIGALEFSRHCASCHGADGRGGGPVARYLSVPPPDLTRLRHRNGGTFPTREVYETIDGRRGPGVHGSHDMPIWGDRYRTEALLGQPLPPGVNPEAIVHGRILTLVFYLQSIQVNH